MANDPSITMLYLEKVQFYARHLITRHQMEAGYLSGADLSVMLEPITGHLVLTLQAAVAAQKLYDIKVLYPRDWWEAVKERFAPVWFTRRYPIRYIDHSVKAYALAEKVLIPKELGTATIHIIESQWPVPDVPFDY